MNNLRRVLQCQRGFMLLNVIFLTLIISFAAMILLNAAPRVRNHHSTLELTALYLAQEQLAHLESLAVTGSAIGGSYGFLGDNEDLTTENAGSGITTEFTVNSTVTNSGDLCDLEVIVSWQSGGKNFDVQLERTILIAQQQIP